MGRIRRPAGQQARARVRGLEESATTRAELAKKAKELAAKVERLDADLTHEKDVLASILASRAQEEVCAFATEKALERPLEALSGALSAVRVPFLLCRDQASRGI